MSISVIIPVYKEEDSLPKLLAEFSKEDSYEIIVVDDSPDDLTLDAIQEFREVLNLKIISRGKRLGLSSAVIEGFSQATGDLLICMDGDASHPPGVIPQLIDSMKGNDMVFASRYVDGGMVDEQWSIFRRMISKACCVIAAPLVKIKDPMSGFFALSKLDFDKTKDFLEPISYKVGLEIAVKGRFSSIGEVPFRFAARYMGKSKVTFKVIFGMLWHLILLYQFKIFKRKK